jgi:CheY-like chemotaxis protein
VVVRTARDDGRILVEVTDTGVGIPPADLERIFESFQQGGRGPAREEGTGLGLTLSRRLIELHGGRLWVESEVGVGSRFRFTLPAYDETSGPPVRTGSGAAARVVVIEDDRLSSELFSTYLKAASIDVLAVRDGASGIAAVRDWEPDAVLLDIRLPGIDGWTVLAALQDDPRTSAIPVIVVSIVDERGRGTELGAREYLVKPVARDELLAALARAGVDMERSAS